jgi:hypothetical protein
MRLDRIESAIRSLASEHRRLSRLGLAGAAERCRQQLRYWEFIATLFSMAEPSAPRLAEGDSTSWRSAQDR